MTISEYAEALALRTALLDEMDAAVDRGIKLLDEKRSGWDEEGVIDLDKLNLACTENCILGQLAMHEHGGRYLHPQLGYTSIVGTLGISHSSHFGFNIPIHVHWLISWNLLTSVWVARIQTRRLIKAAMKEAAPQGELVTA